MILLPTMSIIFLLSSATIYGNEFIIQTPSKIAPKTDKKEALEALMEGLQQSPDFLVSIAQMQELSFDLIMQMVDGTFFSSMSKTEIHNIAQECEQFLKRQQEIDRLLEQQRNFLTKQKKNCASRNNSVVVRK